MKKIIQEFKEFALKGNMLDLAIGVIIANAFNAVVTSIVNDVLMPIFGIILGGKDFSNLSIKIGDAQIKYGSLIQTAINFLIVAVCLFTVVKTINLLKHGKPAEEEAPAEEEKPTDIILLEEIRDALKELKK